MEWAAAGGILKLVLGVAIAVPLAFYFLQDRLIFQPQPLPEAQRALITQRFSSVEDVFLRAADGARLHAWHLKGEPLVVYFGGNAEEVSWMVAEAAANAPGTGWLLIDYRGYGASEGASPSEKTVYEDAEGAWDYLRSRGIDPANVFIYGHSLGAAIAIELALHHPEAGGLIAESGFTSIADMAKLRPQYALLPTRLLNQQFDSIGKVSALQLPVLYIHGTADEVVPYRMGEELFRASGGRKRLVAVGGALHDNNAAVGGPLFRGEIRDFVERERHAL